MTLECLIWCKASIQGASTRGMIYQYLFVRGIKPNDGIKKTP